MKQLKPTLRERNRYVAFELTCNRRCTRDEVVKAIWNSVVGFLGQMKAGKMSLWVMDWSDSRQSGILKVDHKSIKDLRVGITALSRVGESEASVNVLGVSGTLKKARGRYMGV
ncbi:MAG: Rpp14/Pop5 family protein [Candidatus Altiarchaeota archaeon]